MGDDLRPSAFELALASACKAIVLRDEAERAEREKKKALLKGCGFEYFYETGRYKNRQGFEVDEMEVLRISSNDLAKLIGWIKNKMSELEAQTYDTDLRHEPNHLKFLEKFTKTMGKIYRQKPGEFELSPEKEKEVRAIMEKSKLAWRTE